MGPVYNLQTDKITPLKHPGNVGPGDTWLIDGVAKLVICFSCRRYIEPGHTYIVYCPGTLASAETYHPNCSTNDKLVEAVATLISES